MTDHEGVNDIACIACRAKKSRCDRKLPQCSQCVAADNRLCQYTKKSKRGIPTGYITGLEARLAETEAALFVTLNAMQQLQTYTNRQPDKDDETLSFQQIWACFLDNDKRPAKEAKARDWERLPLSTSVSRFTWLDEMGKMFDASDTIDRNTSTRSTSHRTAAVRANESMTAFWPSDPLLEQDIDVLDWAHQPLPPRSLGTSISEGRDTISQLSYSRTVIESHTSPEPSPVGVGPDRGERSPSHTVMQQTNQDQSYSSRMYF